MSLLWQAYAEISVPLTMATRRRPTFSRTRLPFYLRRAANRTSVPSRDSWGPDGDIPYRRMTYFTFTRTMRYTVHTKAAYRPLWRRSIHKATAKFETNQLLREAEKRHRRKEREMSQHLHVSLPSGTSCPHCNKICRSRIELLHHLRTLGPPLEGVILV